MRPLREADRIVLERWARSRTSPYRLVARARIVLLAARGRSHREIAQRLRVRPVTVARWLRRFSLFGPQGLVRDAPRTAAAARLNDATVRAILWKTLRETPPNVRRWTTRSMARASGVSHTSVRRVWLRFGIRPNMSRRSRIAWARSLDLPSVDVSGAFFDPPRWAVVLTVSPAHPPTPGAPPKDAGPSPADGPTLSDLLLRLDGLSHRPGRAPWRSLVDPEFLAFLSRIAREHGPRERIQLVAGSSDGFSRSVVRWLEAHPEISVRRTGPPTWEPLPPEDPTGDLRTGSAAPGGFPSLPRLRTELESWIRTGSLTGEPFAWTRN